MSGRISVKVIVTQAIGACRNFAEYEKRFFNFERRNGWTGWEDWLTVEILRRLNSKKAIAYGAYPKTKQKCDILVDPKRVAVEIKVTYITKAEVKKWAKEGAHYISSRAADDAKKLQGLPEKTVKLLLFAAVFESADLMAD
jgi:hypothetical protein